MENNVACYEGIQRIFRNSIVRYLRESMVKLFSQDWEERLKKPFKKEWDDIKQNALISRQALETESKIIDDFDFLSVNHFFNILDLYYFELAGEDPKDSLAKRKKQDLLSWTRSIKNLRDPLSHPSEEDFSYEDSFNILDCSRRTLMVLGLSEDSDKIKTLMDGLRGGSSSLKEKKAPLEDFLPPLESIVSNFIGRNTEFRELRNWFLNPASRRWALAGEGGKGKSALAYEFGLEIKNSSPEPFQTVIWLSAKKRRYVEGCIVEINTPDFCDLNTALNKLLQCFGWIEEIEKPIDTKKDTVTTLLNEFPALVVVDDIDSIDSENEDAIEFFSLNLPQTKSKVLFTSRRVIFGMGGSTTHIKGLSLEETKEFVLSRCLVLGLDNKAFPIDIIQKIHKVTEGSPLYIEDLMRLTAVMQPKDAVDLWQVKGGKDARRYALGREFEILSETAKKVLCAACVAKGAVSFPELEAILGISSERLISGITELQKLFLAPKPRIIENEQRFELNVNTKLLVKEVHGDTELYKRVDAAYKRISGEIQQKSSNQIGAIIRQSLFCVRAKKMTDAELLLVNALKKFPSDTDIIGVLGLVYKSWVPTRITDAREKFTRAYQLKSKKEDMYVHWAKMEIEVSEWTKAAAAAENGLKSFPNSSKLQYLAGYSRSRLGKEFHRQLQNEKAEKQFFEAYSHLKKALKSPTELDAGERSLSADIYRALILICEATRDVKNLSEYFEAWKKEHPDDLRANSEWDRLAPRFGLKNG